MSVTLKQYLSEYHATRYGNSKKAAETTINHIIGHSTSHNSFNNFNANSHVGHHHHEKGKQNNNNLNFLHVHSPTKNSLTDTCHTELDYQKIFRNKIGNIKKIIKKEIKSNDTLQTIDRQLEDLNNIFHQNRGMTMSRFSKNQHEHPNHDKNTQKQDSKSEIKLQQKQKSKHKQDNSHTKTRTSNNTKMSDEDMMSHENELQQQCHTPTTPTISPTFFNPYPSFPQQIPHIFQKRPTTTTHTYTPTSESSSNNNNFKKINNMSLKTSTNKNISEPMNKHIIDNSFGGNIQKKLNIPIIPIHDQAFDQIRTTYMAVKQEDKSRHDGQIMDMSQFKASNNDTNIKSNKNDINNSKTIGFKRYQTTKQAQKNPTSHIYKAYSKQYTTNLITVPRMDINQSISMASSINTNMQKKVNIAGNTQLKKRSLEDQQNSQISGSYIRVSNRTSTN